MLQDVFDYVWLFDKRNDPHLAGTLGADKRVGVIDLLNKP
ncbi:MAG: hypothetical protein DDT29_01212 [Dehalococcoidia bacterium]|nr:hypothetical protein [Bacillota bacterium]